MGQYTGQIARAQIRLFTPISKLLNVTDCIMDLNLDKPSVLSITSFEGFGINNYNYYNY